MEGRGEEGQGRGGGGVASTAMLKQEGPLCVRRWQSSAAVGLGWEEGKGKKGGWCPHGNEHCVNQWDVGVCS